MKILVVYQSKTGYTKKYALWIAQALNADIYDLDLIDYNKIDEYQTIIYGGGLYAVGINGLKEFKKVFSKLNNTKIIVFATGALPYSNKVIDHINNNNFTEEQLNKIKVFYFRGGFDYQSLNTFDKILMTLLKWKIKFKKKIGKKLVGDEIGMVSISNKPTDYTRKENINEIIKYIENAT